MLQSRLTFWYVSIFCDQLFVSCATLVNIFLTSSVFLGQWVTGFFWWQWTISRVSWWGPKIFKTGWHFNTFFVSDLSLFWCFFMKVLNLVGQILMLKTSVQVRMFALGNLSGDCTCLHRIARISLSRHFPPLL